MHFSIFNFIYHLTKAFVAELSCILFSYYVTPLTNSIHPTPFNIPQYVWMSLYDIIFEAAMMIVRSCVEGTPNCNFWADFSCCSSAKQTEQTALCVCARQTLQRGLQPHKEEGIYTLTHSYTKVVAEQEVHVMCDFTFDQCLWPQVCHVQYIEDLKLSDHFYFISNVFLLSLDRTILCLCWSTLCSCV